ncbi:ATP synthase subunit I [Blastococcus sp. Marseille-P5729]|uniref:ATP synthase subunit I n=1 Tax=Blastococcus sp. Marseille-P5729 TaxID=2086582 RepID=UPI001F46CA3E|nr:ATP synthase subunit I [Blastococcus sp. Marseille-P5729]
MKPFDGLMKLVPDLSIPDEPVQPGIAWTMRHLRAGYVTTAMLAAVGSVVGFLVAGWPAVLGVLLGLVIVTLFFAISTWVVVAAGRRDDRLTLPAALVAFTIKVVLLGVVLVLLPRDGPVDVQAMGWAIFAGVIVWLASQVRFVLRQQTFYVEYRPPESTDD